MAKGFTYSKLVFSGMLCILLLSIAVHVHAQSQNSLNLYVWNFGTRDGKNTTLTKNFTIEFEGALIREGCLLSFGTP